MQEVNIAGPIRQLRKNRGMTLQEVADKAGLSVSYISSVERGKTSPTIANLIKICDALHMAVADLIANPEQEMVLAKKGDRQIIRKESGIYYETVYDAGRRMSSSTMVITGDKEYTAQVNYYDEFGYMLQGSLNYNLNGVEYDFEEGDMIYIAAGSEQRYRKTSGCDSISLWIVCNIEDDASKPE